MVLNWKYSGCYYNETEYDKFLAKSGRIATKRSQKEKCSYMVYKF